MSIKTFRASDLAIEIDTETNGVMVLSGANLLWSRAGQKWTTEPPTEPGWYWGWKNHGAVEYFEVCQVAKRYSKSTGYYLCVLVVEHEDECDFDRFTHWLRIGAPEPPK